MSDKQDFEKVAEKLSAIARKQVRLPDMPVAQAVKEGEIMAAAAQEDEAKLTAVGLAADKIAELDHAAGALRYAHAQFTAAMGEIKEMARQWAAEEPKAFELRADILAAVSYGLRNVASAEKAIKRIRQGTGNPDMIQDLMALSELGNKYRKQLVAINFDVNLLDTAAQKADLIGKIYAKAFVEKSTSGLKDTRDRALTYMRTVMGVILDAAEYAFRKDIKRLDYYHSAYRSRTTSTKAPDAAAPEAA